MNFDENEVIGNDEDMNWKDLVAQVENMEPKVNQWIFRALTGWKDCSDDLYSVPIMSSFDEAWQRRTDKTLPGDRKLYESWILNDFKREAHNYLNHLPKPKNFLE